MLTRYREYNFSSSSSSVCPCPKVMSGYQSEIEAITNGDEGTKKQLRRKSMRTHLREDVAPRRLGSSAEAIVRSSKHTSLERPPLLAPPIPSAENVDSWWL